MQVMINGASTYMLVGRVLEEKMLQFFWSPYATHSIDLMFHDTEKLRKSDVTIIKAKKVFLYIYRHGLLLSMFRKFIKQRELTRAGIT